MSDPTPDTHADPGPQVNAANSADPTTAAPEPAPEPDPEMRWLVRLASAGALLLGGAVVWQAYPPNQGRDGKFDLILCPLALFYSIAAYMGLIFPDRANLRKLSAAYFMYAGRGVLKMIISRFFKPFPFEIAWPQLPLTVIAIIIIFSLGHRVMVRLLLRRVPLTKCQHSLLIQPAGLVFWNLLILCLLFAMLMMLLPVWADR